MLPFLRVVLGLAPWFLAAPVVWLTASPLAAQAQAPASADEDQARAQFRLGRAYYDNGDFARAAESFEAAYRSSHRAALLYNLYLAYRDAGDQRRAADALRGYLERETNVDNRAQLSARLAALDHILEEQAAAPAPEPVAPQPPPAVELPAPLPNAATAPGPPPSAAKVSSARSLQSSDDKPTRVWPIALIAGGGALMLGSVVTGVLALGQKNELSDAQKSCRSAGTCDALPRERVQQLEDTRSTGRTFAVVTDVLLFGGLAAAATGALLLLFTPSDRAEDHGSIPRVTTALSCLPGQCAGQLEVHFE